ncbi:tautomerase family protein [Streptomyces sp. APSN-46.1]|uniref:tautomerase family protein n=1 Tax=Streptomyces sp. APSN-46.1 TaxID=2929049 RepID=UPI001FB26D22|nr:tautomerase family protein [Streptomyces sp. APSN-46.1]MCJ1678239.1 tautomerase family protein [Streptomyces sp. APSN-46.1]
MPHLTIKHFPKSLTPDEQTQLVAKLTAAVQEAFACDEGAISIALHPIDPALWDAQVYRPDITARQDTLIKKPNY